MPQLTWFITGCSTKSGFGSLAAEIALARGDRVIATCRGSVERLQHLKDLGAAVLSLDISAKPAAIEAKAKEAVDIYGQIDVLFNNAGYFEAGIAEETPFESRLRGKSDTNRGIALKDMKLNCKRICTARSASHKPSCLIFGRVSRAQSSSMVPNTGLEAPPSSRHMR